MATQMGEPQQQPLSSHITGIELVVFTAPAAPGQPPVPFFEFRLHGQAVDAPTMDTRELVSKFLNVDAAASQALSSAVGGTIGAGTGEQQ